MSGKVAMKALQSPISWFLGVIAVIAGFFELINFLELYWSLVVALGLWGVVSLIHIIRQRKDIAKLQIAVEVAETCSKAPVEFLERDAQVLTRMTELLDSIAKGKTAKSLYYWGGAGFIGDHGPWKELYGSILEDPDLRLVRVVDLKDFMEMRERVLMNMKPDAREDDLLGYRSWLLTHQRYLDDQQGGRSYQRKNEFYDFKGAPLWKYGMHLIVFSEQHVAITFLTGDDPKKQQRSAIVICDADIAQAIAKSIDWHRQRLSLTPKESGDLSVILNQDSRVP